MEKKFTQFAIEAFKMVNDMDYDIHEAEWDGDCPTQKYYDLFKGLVDVYNHYAELANECEDANMSLIQYVEVR